MVAEGGIGFIELGDRLCLARIEQPHRATGEDPAIALEIGGPGSVGDFTVHCPGDVDRVRIEAFGNQRDPPGEIVVDLLFGAGACMGDALLQVAGQLADLGQLIAQLDRGIAADPGGLGGGLLKLAGHLGGAGAHRLFDRSLALVAEAGSDRGNRAGAHLADPGNRGAGRGIELVDCLLQLGLGLLGQCQAFAADLLQRLVHGFELSRLTAALGGDPAVEVLDPLERFGKRGAALGNVSGGSFALAFGLSEIAGEADDPAFDPGEPALAHLHRLGKIVARMLDAGLDQFEQADAAIGQLGDCGIGAVQSLAACRELVTQRGQARRDAVFGGAAKLGHFIELAGERFELAGGSFAVGQQSCALFFLRGAALGDLFVKPFQLASQLRDEFAMARFELAAAALDLFGKQPVALDHPGVDIFGFLGQFRQPVAGRGHRPFVDLANLGDRCGKILFQLPDCLLPGIERGILALAQRTDHRSALVADRDQPGAQ